MQPTFGDKLSGMICIVFGLTIFLWIAMPFLIQTSVALFGIFLCMYGIKLRSGGSMRSQFTSWYYRSRMY